MYFSDEDQKVCEEYMKHLKIKIFENSAYEDQHECLDFLRSNLQSFRMLLYVNQYLRHKHHLLLTKMDRGCHVFEVWQELSRFLNFVEELQHLDYSVSTARQFMKDEVLKWLKPFVHLVMIHSAKALIRGDEWHDDTQVVKHDHSECEARARAKAAILFDHNVCKEYFSEAKSLDDFNFDDLINSSELSLVDATTQNIESYEVITPGFVYEWFKLPDFP